MRACLGWCVASIAILLGGCPGGGGRPPTVERVEFVVGDGQMARAGTAVPVDPAVLVLGAAGRPLAGVEVQFDLLEVTDASVAPASAITGSDGIARTRWTLGTNSALTYLLRASAGGVASAPITATATAGPAAAVRALAGDRQIAAPGAVLPIDAQVRVLDAYGNPVVGETISCSVEAGGGSVEPATTPTDASGTASCGHWTLGTARGENVLVVAAGAAVARRFSAAAAQASADLAARLVDLSSNYPDYVFQAEVTSSFGIASMTAQAGGLPAPIEPLINGTSLLDVDGRLLPRGTSLVHLLVVDVAGAEADAFGWVTVNRPPAITVEKPLSSLSFARPTVDFAARCQDDDPAGCASLVVSLSRAGDTASTVLASGTLAVAGTEDLSAYDGATIILRFEAVDSDGVHTFTTREVDVDSRPLFTPAARLVATVSGEVLDADGTRVLHRSGPDGIAVTDLALGQTAIIGATASPGAGFLTDQGALFVDGALGPSVGEIMEWRGQGAAAHLGFTDPVGRSVRHAGSFAVWDELDVPGRTRPPGLVRRDLAAETEVAITDTALSFDLAANGDVVFSSGGDVSRYREGVEILASSVGVFFQTPSPVTDGTRVAWRTGDARGNNTLYVWDGSARPIANDLCGGYEVEGPWVAFVRGTCSFGTQTGTRVWRLGPAGEEPVGDVGIDEELTVLLPDGTVLLGAGVRYHLAAPGQPPVEVGTTEARAVVRGGRILLLLGERVYEVVR